MSIKSESTARNEERKNEAEHPAFQVIDRRHFVDLGEKAAAGPIEEKHRYPSFVEELMAKLTETERRFEERKLQMQEEISRVRTRLELDMERRLAREKQAIILQFLDVLDNLDRALAAPAGTGNSESLRQGIEMIAGLFRGKLKAQGVEAIPVLGLPYDPNVGQAVGTTAVEDPARDGVVVDEVQPGYRWGDVLLRPAQVRVGRREG
jgi:molecular chaperone GrpE